MIDLNGYEDVKPATSGKFNRLPPGGYVCQIINAHITNSKAGRPMLVLFIDIVNGELAGYFRALTDSAKKFRPNTLWDNSGIFRQLIFDSSGKTSPFFKGLLTCIQLSNPSFKFNPHQFDESLLRGCFVGFVFAEEEYQKRDGSIGVRTVTKFPLSTVDLNNNNFTVPELKKLSATPKTEPDSFFQNASPVPDDDVPF